MENVSKGSPRKRQGEFDLKPIAETDTFRFACHPGVACFNRCCHDIDVVLTPFDVVRLKKKLGLRSDEFLARYTLFQPYKDTDVVLLKLRVVDENDRRCVFLGPEGCTVYEARPVVCRNYPTGLATQNPLEGQSARPYFIIEEEMCRGHYEGPSWTIAEWKENQGATELDRLNRPWLELVARLKALKLKDDKDQKMNIFVMVSFDVDTFRHLVFGSSFLSRFDVGPATTESIRQDDEELLKFGFKWLQFVLFNEGPLRPKK